MTDRSPRGLAIAFLSGSIRRKITLVSVVASVLSLGIVVAGVTVVDTNRAREDQILQLDSLVESTAQTIVPALSFNRLDTAEDSV